MVFLHFVILYQFFPQEFRHHSHHPGFPLKKTIRHFNILLLLSSLSTSMAAGIRKKTPEINGDDDIKKSLMNKFGETFIDKLTKKDLDEFQFFLKKQYSRESGWNSEYKLKFESKLRRYFHEEVMKREIASIETLLGLLDQRDLKK
jgi:hypothetical protein